MSEIMREWRAAWNARAFSLWFVHRSGALKLTRGGLFVKRRGETFVLSSFNAEVLDTVRGCLLLAASARHWRGPARACLVELFEGQRRLSVRAIEEDIRQNGRNDFNVCDLEAARRDDPARTADALLEDFMRLLNKRADDGRRVA